MKSYQKQIINWDTSLNISEFPETVKSIFNKFYFKERRKFTLWLDKIPQEHSSDLDWWVSPPASRNLYFSNLYKYICILKTLQNLSDKFKFIIITDSYAFKKIVKNIKDLNVIKVKIKFNKKSFFKNFFYLYIIKNILIYSVQYFLIKILYKKKILNNSIIVDTFIIDKEKKEKFYYGDLLSYSNKKKKKLIFLATIIENNIYKFLHILISLRKKKNYILKENYLNLKDLIYCFSYINRIKKFNIKFNKFDNFELTDIIKEEIFYNRNLFSIFIGLSNFSFFKKLNDNSIKIKKVINWFENQPMDKGFNYGLRKFFPNTLSLGYQGFTDYPEYMNTYPSISEFNSKVIPKQIIVCGNRYKKLRKEFCKKLDIINGPALRAEKIFKLFKKKNRYKIVIFLEGGTKKNDIDIISKFIDISKNFKNLKFFIKTHPILPLNKLDIQIPKNFEVVNGDFSTIAKKTFIAVSYGNTSATLESLAYGCNLIIPFDNFFDKKNLSIFRINKNFFRVCNNNLEINNAIKFFLNIKNSKRFSNRDKIKNILFNKVNKKTLSVLL